MKIANGLYDVCRPLIDAHTFLVALEECQVSANVGIFCMHTRVWMYSIRILLHKWTVLWCFVKECLTLLLDNRGICSGKC